MFETWRVLRSCKPVHYKDAFNLLLTSSIGGLMPLWGLAIIMRLSGQHLSLYAFTKNGELALYAASFASAALYYLAKEYSRSKAGTSNTKKAEFPAKSMFQNVFVGIIVITSIIFTWVTQKNTQNLASTIDINYLINASVVVFLASLLFSYISSVVDNYLTSYDEEDMRNSKRKDLNEFKDQFESLEEE